MAEHFRWTIQLFLGLALLFFLEIPRIFQEQLIYGVPLMCHGVDPLSSLVTLPMSVGDLYQLLKVIYLGQVTLNLPLILRVFLVVQFTVQVKILEM